MKVKGKSLIFFIEIERQKTPKKASPTTRPPISSKSKRERDESQTEGERDSKIERRDFNADSSFMDLSMRSENKGQYF